MIAPTGSGPPELAWILGPGARSGVLAYAVAEGPVLLLDLDEIDENVLTPEPDTIVQPISDRLVKGLFDLDGASLVEGELDDQRVRAAFDVEIGRIDDQGFVRVLGNHLEAIVLGRVQRRDHRFKHDIGDRAAITGRLAGWQINAGEWHGGLRFFLMRGRGGVSAALRSPAQFPGRRRCRG